jgi:iron complex outermembrane receptor protein
MKKLLITYFLILSSVFAQSGNLTGFVYDNSGQPIAGANVLVQNTNTGAATDAEGKFVIPDLRYGSYRLEISSIGYRRITTDEIIFDQNYTPKNFILEEEAVQTGQVVVTAGKYEQNIKDLPVSSVVIQPGIIDKKNFSSLDDVLRYVPGVQLNLDQLSIRGSTGYSKGAGTRVLVAIDGVPMYSGDTGDIVWELVPLIDIERIEIIKGPASSLYGTTAIGGVINIITKKSSDSPVAHIHLQSGIYDKPSYDSWDWSKHPQTYYGLSADYSNSTKNFGYTFSLKKYDNESYRENDFSKRILGYTKLNYNFSENSSLTLLGNYLWMNRGNFLYWKDSRNTLVPKDEDRDQTVKSNRVFLSLIYDTKFNDAFGLQIKSSFYRTHFKGIGKEITESTANLFRNELIGNIKLSNDLVLVSGIEGSYARVNSNIFSTPNFYSGGAYFQAEYRGIDKLIITAGLRDDYIKLDTLIGTNAVTPRLGLNYKLSKKIILRASIGTGFRAPTPAEVFTTSAVGSGIDVVQNTDLKSEKSVAYEVGMQYSPNPQFNFDAAFFNTDYKNFIEPTLTTDAKIKFLNLPKARIQGVDLFAKYNFEKVPVNISAGYTYLWARDLELNKFMKYRPRHLFYGSVEYNPSPFNFRVDFRYWSRYEEIDDLLVNLLIKDGDKRVPVYVTDLSIGYNFFLANSPMKIFFNAKNIFNYNYVEFIGNLAPIRKFSLNLEMYL